MRLFISSVQKEFADERAVLLDYLRGDPLLRQFFEVFLFEEMPAADRRADAVYLDEVRRCDIYIGLFGQEYGRENADGMSPTHLEFQEATRLSKTRLIFVKGSDDADKHPKMQTLIGEAGDQLVRRRFNSSAELITAVYAALVHYLEEKEFIRTGPFDASPCRKSSLADLDQDRIRRFLRLARKSGIPVHCRRHCHWKSCASLMGRYRRYDCPLQRGWSS